MKRKIFSILFTLVLAVSLMAVPVAAYFPGGPTDDWQFNEGDGIIEWSTDAAYAGDWSVYMKSSPTSSTEAYIKTTITDTSQITSGSFRYNRLDTFSNVIPHVDIWIDTDDDGVDDQWLLGIGPDETSAGAWEQISFVSMNWYDAMGTKKTGPYGSFALAMADWTGDDVIGIGIAVGSNASWAQGQDQRFYVDDLVVNATTYALEPGPTGSVGLFTEVEEITAISVTPTNIDFGTLYPGQTPPAPTSITVSNIGTVTVEVNASVTPTGKVFDYLKLDGDLVPVTNLITGMAGGSSTSVAAQLVVPRGYSATGVEIATLIFVARPQ